MRPISRISPALIPSSASLVRLLALCGTIIANGAAAAIAADDASLGTAREHSQKGRYAEAREAFIPLLEDEKQAVAAAIGLSRAHEAEGEWDEAQSVVEKALAGNSKSAALAARLGEIHLRRSRHAEAEKQAKAAIALDADQPLAHLVLAHAFAETGRLAEADDEYRWFIRYYNRAQPKDAETLLLVAEGSLQYARWHGVSQVFDFVVNTLCPDALAADENAWRAHRLSGATLLEKYNRADALPDLKAALAVNPRAADAIVSLGEAALQQRTYEEARTRADEALKVDPSHGAALRLAADIALARADTKTALATLAKAQAIAPHDQRTLARVALAYLIEDGFPEDERLEMLLANIDAADQIALDDPSRFERLAIDLARRNPRPGPFLHHVGDALESRLKFDVAERFYRTAIRVMPQLSEPKTSLGMLAMRTGRTAEAAKILDDAFKADPYHVRVSNMRKVLRLLEGYRSIETDHFVIRVDSELDAVLGEYMAEYLEEIYPELVGQYGFEPPQRTHFEIFNQAKGVSAHEWFSARMVGLPWIQTIGASTGMMVAMASPTAAEKPFNWARVLKHEFVHIITLQQTKFNIPHWFTEALAVTAEDSPRPEEWDELLLDRVPKGELGSLDELNDGFQRPKTPDDWQFAYCQSRLYAQYMIEKHGPETIPKMLAAYRAGESTREAIPKAFGVDVATFEKGYREFVDGIVAELKRGAPAAESRSIVELEKAHRDAPDDAATAGAYARALLKSGERRQAREIALKALAADKATADAALVMAQLELLAENVEGAIGHLRPALDRDQPHLEVLKMLAPLLVRADETDEAERLYVLGRETFPRDPAWLPGLAALYRFEAADDELREVLAAQAARDTDDADSRKELARMHLGAGEFEQAIDYGRQAMQIDVLDANLHATLARAYAGDENHARAAREFHVALQLKPGDDAIELDFARTQLALDLRDAARKSLDAILERTPDHAEARALRDALK
ncbi:MAG: tetratricopeptide repeat protein [Planctomycetaceae bacterium]